MAYILECADAVARQSQQHELPKSQLQRYPPQDGDGICLTHASQRNQRGIHQLAM